MRLVWVGCVCVCVCCQLFTKQSQRSPTGSKSKDWGLQTGGKLQQGCGEHVKVSGRQETEREQTMEMEMEMEGVVRTECWYNTDDRTQDGVTIQSYS